MADQTLAYQGFSADNFHRRVGLIGKGPMENNITKLTTRQTGVIKLSPLDYPETSAWTPLLIPFENINHEEEYMLDAKMIASLQQVIERVPIVTGQLERIDGTPMDLNGPNSPLQVCIGKSSVWYTSTSIKGSIQEFKESGFNCEKLDSPFLFSAANDAIIRGDDYPLLAAKISRFNCGSVVLLVTACHLIVDAHSIYELLKTWSMVYCGVPDAPLIKESRHLFTYDNELNEKLKSIRDMFENMPKATQAPFKLTKILHASIDDKKFKAFKQEINAKLVDGWVSSDDVMVCLGWRAFARARCLDPTSMTTIARIVDVRKLNQPPLPPHAFGNGVFGAVNGSLAASTLLDSPIHEICHQLRSRVAALTANEVRNIITACSKLATVHHPPGGDATPFSKNNFSSSYNSFHPEEINFQHSPALTVTRACYTEGIIAPQPIINGIYSCKMSIDSTHADMLINDPDLNQIGFTILS
ncbi:hypothetical protein DSO57_1021407 [Entomophthora muscae]|uniref:Uncharacterized protein n=1 Tax=Entomophthora muscae TaxID=34485 RepID=A0ACC2SGI3_9FUNG|nr:hypothetical protein DSO57_1021407 [Entomophthora muscae]